MGIIARRRWLAAGLFVLAPVWGASAAPYTPGNLIVVRLGDGVQTLANTGNTVNLTEFTVAGALVGTTTIPDSGPDALIMSGNASSEGLLSRSGNGSLLTFGGYNVTRPFATSLAAATSTAVPRAVGSVNQSGTYTLAATTTAFSANNIRAAVSDNGTNYYAAGGNSGTVLLPGGTAIQTAIANTRVISVFNNNLYFSTQSGTGGIYGFSGIPTTASVPTLLIPTGTGNPNEFAISPSGTLAYIADDRTSANGGVQRWEFNGSAWVLAYTLGTGAASIGARGLEVDFSGADPIVYATTAEATGNRLIGITDTGAASVASTLATAATGTIFRGVEFAPVSVPEPATVGLVVGIGMVAGLRRRRR